MSAKMNLGQSLRAIVAFVSRFKQMSLLLAWCLLAATLRAAPVTTRLASDNKPLWPVVVAEAATAETRLVATSLAGMLTRISGATFEVVDGKGAAGIVVGVAGDFPDLTPAGMFDTADPMRREEYLLQSYAKGLRLIGASAMAVENAAWDLLYRLGFRQFFPGPIWEVVPEIAAPAVAVDVVEKPAYLARRIWFGHGVRRERSAVYHQWLVRNRVRRGFTLTSGHSYDAIIRANAAAFKDHPEYYALVDGERRLAGQIDGGGNIKFCVSNPGLRALVVAHAQRFMRENPDHDSISMDPSDGGNWCECEACVAMGSVSDRVLTLANEVAAAINELDLGNKYVGMYAYGFHSPPPSIKVHPKVIVSATAGFLRGGFTLEDVISGWQARGAVMGLYDYFSVMPWDWDLPGSAKGSGPSYMAESLPRFHAMGIRFHDAESSDNWGPNGLGYYTAARILWDLGEAKRLDAIREDFLERAFGPAAEPMREFYRLIDRNNRPLLSDDLLGRMYRALSQGLDLARERPAVQARLFDLALYTRYAELWLAGDQRATVRHAHRIRDTGMVHFRALWDRLHEKLELARIPEEWIQDALYTPAEVRQIIAQGLASHAIFEFTPQSYSEELVPAALLNLPETPRGSFGDLYAQYGTQGGADLFTWFKRPGQLDLQITGGLIAHYRDRGNVKLALYSPQEVTLEPVAVDQSVPPDGEERTLSLATSYDGLHRLELRDGGDSSRLRWPDDWPMTIKCSPDAGRLPLYGQWTLVFYVPRGCRSVAGFTDSGRGKILNSTGQVVLSFADLTVPGYFDIPVPAGTDGSLWRIENHNSRNLMLLTVPPYLARNAKELLLPREIVESDRREP